MWLWREAKNLEDLLKSREGLPLFVYEDVSLEKPSIRSARDLANVVDRVVCVLGNQPRHQQLRDKWAEEGM